MKRKNSRSARYAVLLLSLGLTVGGAYQRFGEHGVQHTFSEAPRALQDARATADMAQFAAENRRPPQAAPARAVKGTGVHDIARLHEVAARNVHELKALLLETMGKCRAYDEFVKCTARHAACSEELSVLLYEATAAIAQDIETDPFDIGGLVGEFGAPATEAALIVLLREVHDPIDRFSVLHLLSDWESGVRPVELPAEFYHDLQERPVAEAQELLSRHLHVPVSDPETRATLARIGSESTTDSRLWRSIVGSLGYPQTSQEFAQVVGAQRLDSVQLQEAAVAAARCGMACSAVLDRIGKLGDEGRSAAYRGLSAAEPAELRGLLAVLPTVHTEDERRQREALVAGIDP
jgi:hypothetical protein